MYGDRDITKNLHSFISIVVPWGKLYIKKFKKYKEEMMKVTCVSKKHEIKIKMVNTWAMTTTKNTAFIGF